MTHVFYHSNCYDGFGAAYACWKKFGDSAEYHAVSYGYPSPNVEGDILYIVDFSYKRNELYNLKKRFNKLIILDHHKTAEEELKPLIDQYDGIEIHFDIGKSGALMTWEYLHGSDTIPKLIQHISDRDLWQFKLEGTAKIHKALVSYPLNFELWDTFEIEKLKLEGITCERLYIQLVDSITKSYWMKDIAGYKVPIVNTTIAWSEVGQRLLEREPTAFFAVSFTVFEDQIMWSLRSRSGKNEIHFDVSEIAKKFGGGGHKNAAGFKTQRF